jgi:rare lipoprotein A
MTIFTIILSQLLFQFTNNPVDNCHGETKVSWYGEVFHRRKTANGETFDMNALTCASPTLPFGTRIKITNPSNGKTVIVRVNDRGSYKVNKNGKHIPHPKRSFDISKAAFQSIANLNKGTIRVEFVILK